MPGPQDLATVEAVPHGRTARRLEWAHLPPQVRALVEERLGSPVVHAESQGSGFTPGFASRLTAADGSRMFVKAASRKAQAPFAEAYAEEARTVALLPEGIPAPRLLWSHHDDLWVLLAFECVESRPPRRPWREAELLACLDTLATTTEVTRPILPSLGLKPLTEELPGLVSGWEYVAHADPGWPHLDEVRSLVADHALDPAADSFVHSDARDDNFLLTADGTALLCDWNWPALGPAWLDAVWLLVSAYGDGLDADAVLTGHPLTREADPDQVDGWLAMLCGLMLEARDRPVPPTSPYLRVHARWWSEAAWAWLAARRGWR